MLMNSRLVRDAASSWAKSLPDSPAAIVVAYRAALSRPPSDAEMADATTFIQVQKETYAGKPDAAHLALADFCQTLLSLNEFAYVE